jgi:uncharacterized repeat protein (TIGR01451 family)
MNDNTRERSSRMKLKILACLIGAIALMLTGCNDCNVCQVPGCDTCPATPIARGSNCDPSNLQAWGSSCGVPCGSSIQLEKIVPTEVRNNCPFEYQIKLTNLCGDTLSNVVVTDQLPENLRFECATPEMTSMEGGLARWELGCLGPNECMIISINAIAEGEGCISSCAKVTYENPVCAMMNIVESKLTLSKCAPECAMQCDRIPLSYVITNCGNANACDVMIKDHLPDGLITCDGSDVVCFNAGEICAGESKEFQVFVDPVDVGTFGSLASATSSTCDAVESNYAATKVIKPDLEIVQSGPSEQYICRDVCYTVTVMNKSDCTAEDTVVMTDVPCNAYLSCSEGGQLCGDQIRWNVGDLAPGASRTYNFVLTGNQPGILESKSQAQAYCAEPVCAESETVISGIPALLMEVVDLCDPIEVGQTEAYIITITNQGTATATNVMIGAQLEDNWQYVSSSGPTVGQIQGSRITFGALPQLCPGDKAVWRVNAKAISEGDTRFKAMMNSDQLTRDVEETEATNVFMATPCGR